MTTAVTYRKDLWGSIAISSIIEARVGIKGVFGVVMQRHFIVILYFVVIIQQYQLTDNIRLFLAAASF